MTIRLFLPLFFITITIAQTHFTIPQNVWRLSLEENNKVGNWKGHDGRNGWNDFPYQLDTSVHIINQHWENNINTQSILIEYGVTNRYNFIMNIPIIKNFKQTHTWLSPSADIDTLMYLFHPKNKSTSGLGDVTLGFNVLVIGNPSWRGGKNKYSLYSGVDMIMPFAKPLEKFNSKDVDENGVPYHFKDLPIGRGLAQWRVKTFGEFYRKIKGRLININWSTSISTFSRNEINPEISFLSVNETISPDSIARSIGSVLYDKGNQLYGSLIGQIEVLPKKCFVSMGMDWMVSGRDKYFSNNDSWDKWMVERQNFDTKKSISSQLIKVNLLNIDSFDRFGPIPFELEIGTRWFVPILTKHSFGYRSSWIRISSYFQAW